MNHNRLSKTAYQKRRLEVYERDGGLCVLCGRQGAHIHHIVFRSQGGTDDMENLVTLCGECHDHAHGKWIGKEKKTQKEIRRVLLAYARCE